MKVLIVTGGTSSERRISFMSARQVRNALKEVGHQVKLFDFKLQKIIQKIALKIHQTLSLGQYSRIDFMVLDRKPYVLEVNTIPGLTASSLFPKAAQAVGISFPKLMDKIVKTAYAKHFSKTI